MNPEVAQNEKPAVLESSDEKFQAVEVPKQVSPKNKYNKKRKHMDLRSSPDSHNGKRIKTNYPPENCELSKLRLMQISH